MNSFAERLAQAISYREISQAELARRTGIGRNSISDYLKSKYEAKQDNLFLLANALGVNEAWLMGLDVEMEKDTLSSIFNQLEKERQENVVQFAKSQLEEQNGAKLVNFPNDSLEIPTLAAHATDPNKKFTEEEITDINNTLDELAAKYDEKRKR